MKIVYSFILALLCLCSCSKDIVETTGDISGLIRDARTNNLLEGVTVTLSQTGKTTTTGSDGRYSFANVESQNYIVQVSKAGYKEDSKPVYVSVGQNNSLDFSLTPSLAVLNLNTSSIDFGNENTTQTFTIKNTGNAALTWSISEDVSWLSCIPASGTTQSGETSSVVVYVKRDGLDRGNYSRTIAIASNGGSEVVNVNMAVQGVSVKLLPEQLDFGSVSTSMQLTMTNNGNSSISYSLTPSNNWIKLSKTTGVFTSTENITVSVDRTSFSAGDYSGNVKLTVGDQELNVPVRMNIPNKEKPTVSLYSVDNVTFNSAMPRGAIVSIGSAKVTRHGFCWGTTDEPTVSNAKLCNFGDCATAKDFNYNLSGLNSNTAYYVRAYAENSEGISYSNVIKIVTSGTPQKPEIETGAITDVLPNQVSAFGNIVSLGNVESLIQYGHVWSTKEAPTTNDSKTTLGKTVATGAYNSTLTGLSPNTKYYVRAYAINQIGTSYGEEVSFITPLANVSLSTSAANNITYNSASINVSIVSAGGHSIVERGVCWNTSTSPTISNQILKSDATTNSFVLNLKGLNEKTKYFVRAYVKTATAQVFYGNEISFTTNEKDININKQGYGNDNNWNR